MGLCCTVLLLAGCGQTEPGGGTADGTEAARSPWRYDRETTFLTWDEAGLASAPFSFSTVPLGERHEREVHAWLADGETWDEFLREAWSSSATGGLWRVVPHGELRIAAGGPGVEALWYESGGRRLRLDVGDPRSQWHGGERERFRMLGGTMTVGASRRAGLVFEELQVSRGADAGDPDILHDRIILLDRNGFALYLLHERAAGTSADAGRDGAAWVLTPGSDEAAQGGTVEWVEMRPLEEARRDIPLRWRFAAPEAGLAGEVAALGYHATLGAERGGRRGVAMRYTVEGWIERDGERVEVMGIVRHQQR